MFSLILFLALLNLYPKSYYKKSVFFKNTDFELSVYHIYGEDTGPTVLIIGGIQGDEPAGYMAADSYVHLGLKRGNLIIVPRADLASIFLHKRQVNADMNRRFARKKVAIWEDKVVDVIKSLMKEADFFINLHEGSGFFREKYINDMKNPMRFGQSIIIDTKSFYSKKYKKTFNLESMAKVVINSINKSIDNPEFRFHLNNHHTKSKNTLHPEQRKSATYYAVYKLGIPSFAIETSKEIGNLQEKIKMHVKAINAFLREFGVEFSFPYSFLKPVVFNYLLALVDGEYKVLKKGDTLYLNSGSSLNLLTVSVDNKDIGITADLLNYGSINDLKKMFIVEKSTKIIVRSDYKILASIPVKIGKVDKTHLDTAILLSINGKDIILRNGQVLDVLAGSKLFIRGASGLSRKDVLVNFVGYSPKTYTENDIGKNITVPDNLLKRFAVARDTYEIYLKYNGKKILRSFVKVVPAGFKYVIFKRGNERIAVKNGESVKAEDLKLLDIISDCNLKSIDIAFPCGRVSFDDALGKDLLDLSNCGTIETGNMSKRVNFYVNNKFMGYIKLLNRR